MKYYYCTKAQKCYWSQRNLELFQRIFSLISWKIEKLSIAVVNHYEL